MTRIICCIAALGMFYTAFAQVFEPASPVVGGSSRETTGASAEVRSVGLGPWPDWWAGAVMYDPYEWGGWEARPNEVYMHVLDMPTADYPNIRFGFSQYSDASGELRYREVYVMLAHTPLDFLVEGKWKRWKVRVDSGYEWRYLGYWRPLDGWDAVVVERELPGLIEFCEGDADGRIWVVLQFEKPGAYLEYWSGYEFCPSAYTYGVQCLEWGRVTAITRWPVPYFWPPCYVQWTNTGHRVWN